MNRINKDTIVHDPAPILREKAALVPFPLQSEDIELIERMVEYVRDSRDDVLAEKYNLQPANGIAAPQVGVSKQIFVVVIEDAEGNPVEYALVNPRIVSHSVKQSALDSGEGCLSVVEHVEGFVPRHWRIVMKAYDYLQGKDIEIKANNLLSIVLQHEYDHLQGVLYYDYIDNEDPWGYDDTLKIIE